METTIIIALIVAVAMAALGFVIGSRGKKDMPDNSELIQNLRSQLSSLTDKIKVQEDTIAKQQEEVKTLTSERDVQKVQADNYKAQLITQKSDFEKQMNDLKGTHEAALAKERDNGQKLYDEQKVSFTQQMQELKTYYEKQIKELKNNDEQTINTERERNAKRENELTLTFDKQTADLKTSYEKQIDEIKHSYDLQLAQIKETAEKQIEALKQMNKEHMDSQTKLIREQMQTTSEEILKRRQEELGERNTEQVSKIINPLQQSLKDMQEAFDKSKQQQSEALTRLDETIKINMQKSVALGETADRLTRALTGEVKVQGNFGELKLKQLLEDLELKEGEQFDTQETLKDKAGKQAKGDDGRGLIPDFILHFPNNRHVVVDSKMSLTDYERYMNAEDGTPEKTEYLKSHIASVRAQVKRLAKKEYTKYLPSGYNKLNFAIMYVPIEGALNLALLNDDTLWREAYDQGVMILGPQTMYMNLRVLEMMWTQVRQLKNQQMMMDAANTVIDRVQDFGIRFMDVESSMNDTIKKISKLKITTADSGASIITAAKKLIKAGAQENKKKKSLADMSDTLFLEEDATIMLPEEVHSDKSSEEETKK